MNRSARITKSLLFFVFFLIFIFASCLLSFSFFHYETVKQFLDSLSADHQVESFTPERFQLIQMRVRIVSIAVLLLNFFLWIKRNDVERFSETILVESRSYLKNLFRRIIHGIKSEKRVHLFVLIIIFFWGFFLRLAHLFQPISYDEAFTYLYFVKRPLFIGLSDYSYPNNHLFHTFLSHLSCSVFGNEEWVIRLPAFIAGVLIIPMTYLSARKLFNKETALLAMSLVAVSNVLIEYSVMARGYTMLTLFFLVLIFLSDELEKRKGSWIFFILISALALYTVPVFVFALMIIYGQFIFLSTGICIPKKKILVALFSTLVLTALLYLPPVLVSGMKSLLNNPYIGESTTISNSSLIQKTVAETFLSWKRGISIVIFILLSAGFLFSVVIKQNRKWIASILFMLIILLIGVLMLHRIPPARIWLFLVPLLFIISSSGMVEVVTKIKFKKANWLFSGLALALLFYQSSEVYSMKPAHWSDISDNEKMAVAISHEIKPGDRLLSVIPTDYPLEYYLLKNHVVTEFLRSNTTAFARLFIVVNESNGQTPRDILTTFGIDGNQLKAPETKAEFRFSKLLLYTKK
ncbi:MAG: glycosyltransferase family 39 protein [Bacteroidetes bacterium]|nr:glycosyltransferase family 39 protein [Bacteroidota bacterium]